MNHHFDGEPNDIDQDLTTVGLEARAHAPLPALPASPAGSADDKKKQKALPEGLRPVPTFSFDWLPESVIPFAKDIHQRLRCPPEFVAIPLLVGLGAAIGAKVAVAPEQHGNWREVPNLWGLLIGRPGSMKSPATTQALAPLRRLQDHADRVYAKQSAEHKIAQEQHQREKKVLGQKAESAMKSENPADEAIEKLRGLAEPDKPVHRRLIVNDVTYEMLGIIMSENPTGVLMERDEIAGLIGDMSKEEFASARGFMLQAWNGLQPYTFDRVTRGSVIIRRACLSVLGGIQPGKLTGLIHEAVSGGRRDDGMLQRFSVMVWPDKPTEPWRPIDIPPDDAARRMAEETFEALHNLQGSTIACPDPLADVPFLRFSPGAYETYIVWRTRLEAMLQEGTLSSALESHLAKFRKLVPTLALLIHLAEGSRDLISASALDKALKLGAFFEEHARRCYASGTVMVVDAAKAIARRLEKGDLSGEFTAREIYTRSWSHLTDASIVKDALELLVDYEWLEMREVASGPGGGRKRLVYKSSF